MKTNIAILARAPVPGFAKTRLIPAIGAHAAAMLQQRLTEQTVASAVEAGIGSVTLWCTPDPGHSSFIALGRQSSISLKRQPEGDLGARVLAAFSGSTLVTGSDCPTLTPQYLRDAAEALSDVDVVLIPAEDGGYVLIGARAPHSGLFTAMTWGTNTVLAETRKRIAALGLKSAELSPLWDVDSEGDLARMERELPTLAL